MAKSSRGRRSVSEQFGLVGDPDATRNPDPAPAGRTRASRGTVPDDVVIHRAGRPSSPRRKPTPKRRRGRLPSDSTILGAMIKSVFKWVYRLVATFVITSVALVILYRFIDPPLTPLMVIRSLEGLGGGELVWIDKEWIDIDRVDPALLRSVIAAEDARFFTHTGVDWDAVEQAQKRNERAQGKKLYGASTITMQCAKNVFLWQGRNYIRKGLEFYFTYLIELVWGKKRILEVYVNVIEWGDGIYGVEAAAQKYFGTSASELTPRQAALLAAVLPNPRTYSAAKPSSYVSRRASTTQARAGAVSLGPLKETAAKEPETSEKPKRSSRKK